MSRKLIRPLLALGVGLFGMAAAGPVYNTFVPILLHDFGLSATLVGFIMTWDNWLNIFISPWVGYQSDHRWTRWGRRKPWIAIGITLAAFFILIPLMPALAGMLAMLLLASLGLSIARSPGLALLGDLFPPKQRSAASGVINVFGGLGAVTALVASSYLLPLHPAAPFIFAGVLLLVGGLALILIIKEPKQATDAPLPATAGFWQETRSLLQPQTRGLLLLLIAIFLGFCGFNVAETWLSTYAHLRLGIAEARLPLLMAVFAAALLVAAIPSGLFAARVGRKRLVLAGMIALTTLFTLAPIVDSVDMLYLLLIAAGLAWAPVLVNTLPLMYDVGDGVQFGAMTGFYYVSLSLAAILGPQFVGVALDASGQDYRLIWIFAALFMGLGTLLLTRVQREVS
ncbi:MAG: SLC45 family MFS transporter [Chloroflexi bacterium]|nr:SLC45 family MFS transporter [Chloroflexota bacterium]